MFRLRPFLLALLTFNMGTFAVPLAGPKTIMSINKTCGQLPSSRALVSKRVKANATILTAIEGGSGYTVPLQFGQETFDVFFDTGSSDLWLASNKLRCVDAEQNSLPQADCGFGPLFNSTFSDGKIADQNFMIRYLGGQFLTGETGYQDVTLSGITVENQQVALVDYGYWSGEQEYNGLLGFAYPGATNAFRGTDPSKNDYNAIIHYKPFFWNAFEQGKVESLFSLALTRETEGEAGQLALGCLPNIPHKGDFASTPLEAYRYEGSTVEVANFTYYTIVPDAFILHTKDAVKAYVDSKGHTLGNHSIGSLGHMSNRTRTQVIVDSGTTFTYLPNALAEQFNALFDPPAVYIEDQDIYEVDCNAMTPTFGIRIGGQDFYFDDRDLLPTGELGLDTDTGLCVTGIQPGDSGPFILGSNFLKNVVAVFDVGNVEMRFAPQA